VYGFNNLVSTPSQVNEALNTIKPLTPQQSRIDSLKRQKDAVAKQLKAERDRQKIAKAQQQMSKAQQSIAS
jgi:hypothetical protein